MCEATARLLRSCYGAFAKPHAGPPCEAPAKPREAPASPQRDLRGHSAAPAKLLRSPCEAPCRAPCEAPAKLPCEAPASLQRNLRRHSAALAKLLSVVRALSGFREPLLASRGPRGLPRTRRILRKLLANSSRISRGCIADASRMLRGPHANLAGLSRISRILELYLSQCLLIALVIELRASYILRHSLPPCSPLPPPPPSPTLLPGARAVLVVATALEERGIGFFARLF